MSRWFRHYAGMMSDPKFGGVARFCKRSRAEVLFVWGCLLESASEYDSAVYSWDADAIAEMLGIETEVAQAIHDALAAKGLIEGGRIASWDRRQFKSDDSAERVKEHRQRKKIASETTPKPVVTPCNGDVTPPETEAYPDTETEKNPPPTIARETDQIWVERLAEVTALAGEALDRTSPAVHQFSDLRLFCEPANGEPCTWPEVLDATRACAASALRRRKPIRSWTWLKDHVYPLRDRRVAGAPAVQALSSGPDPPRRHSLAEQIGDESRRAKEMTLTALRTANG